MLKIGKELDLQQKIIDTCIAGGGFGYKLQDRYVKGKPDVWLKLPSGIFIFSEVKIERNVRYTVTPKFTNLQLDCMEKLTEKGVPVIGLIFAILPEGHPYFKISSYFELKRLKEKDNLIKYSIEDFHRVRSLNQIVEAIERFFAKSKAQIIKINAETGSTFYSDFVV